MKTVKNLSLFMILAVQGNEACAASASRLSLSRAIAPIKSFASANPGLTKIAGMWALVGTGYLLYKWWWNRKYYDTLCYFEPIQALGILPNGNLVMACCGRCALKEDGPFENCIVLKIWDVQRRQCLRSEYVPYSSERSWVLSITPLSNECIAVRLYGGRSIHIVDLQNHSSATIPYPPASQKSGPTSEVITLQVERGSDETTLIARNGRATYCWNMQGKRWDIVRVLDGGNTQRIFFGSRMVRNELGVRVEEPGRSERVLPSRITSPIMAGLADGRLALVGYGSSDPTGLVQIWNIDANSCEQEIKCGFPVTSMVGLPDGNVVVAGIKVEAGAKILRVAPRRDGVRSTPPDSLHPMNAF